MTQPANKRFVMEDSNSNIVTTGTITSGNITSSGNVTTASGNITTTSGTVSASKVRGTSTTAANATDTAIIAGASSSAQHVGISNSGISSMSDATTPGTLSVQSSGGNLSVGSAGAGLTFNGTTNAVTLAAGGGSVSVGTAATTVTINGELTARGYRLVSRSVYTSSPAAFTKASYPWLRAVRVICLGAGGGAGGAALTAAGQNSIGQAGAGGAYAETFITNIAGLGASETLIVGAAGNAGAAGGNGGNGGDTSFGTWCIAKGGVAGVAGPATAVGSFSLGASALVASSSTGDIIYSGGASGVRQYAYNASVVRPFPGGNTLFPTPPNAQTVTTTGSNGVPPNAGVYGVGGYPGMNTQSQAAAVSGGAGAGGLMIVELYA